MASVAKCWRQKPPNFAFAGSCTFSEYFPCSCCLSSYLNIAGIRQSLGKMPLGSWNSPGNFHSQESRNPVITSSVMWFALHYLSVLFFSHQNDYSYEVKQAGYIASGVGTLIFLYTSILGGNAAVARYMEKDKAKIHETKFLAHVSYVLTYFKPFAENQNFQYCYRWKHNAFRMLLFHETFHGEVGM